MLDLAQSSTDLVLPFKDGGRYYLFDGSSTAIAEVRRDLFHVVERAKRIGLSRALDDVQSDGGEDASAGLRATLAQLRAKRFFGVPVSARVQQPDGDAPLMEAYLSLVDGCNLRCRYCFVPSQQTAKNRYMSVETATRAMDFLVARADKQHGLSIVLWGGEPLLNLTLVRTVLERGAELSAETGIPIRFATTTNCTLLTPEASELLIRHRVIVNMSIDGDAASHDLHRIFPGGRGTSDVVAKRVRAFIALARHEWPAFVPRARLTLTRPTVSRLAENCRSVWSLGIPIVWMKDVDWQANDGAMNFAARGLRRDPRAVRDPPRTLPHAIGRRSRRRCAAAALVRLARDSSARASNDRLWWRQHRRQHRHRRHNHGLLSPRHQRRWLPAWPRRHTRSRRGQARHVSTQTS